MLESDTNDVVTPVTPVNKLGYQKNLSNNNNVTPVTPVTLNNTISRLLKKEDDLSCVINTNIQNNTTSGVTEVTEVTGLNLKKKIRVTPKVTEVTEVTKEDLSVTPIKGLSDGEIDDLISKFPSEDRFDIRQEFERRRKTSIIDADKWLENEVGKINL